ncbi:MAG: thiamine diphosphokinase [Treponema sp.]|jgi:thiamine pyrophosphokinase|nr:thiamine diphosphokinase [Treponema sp.]
MRGIVFTGGEGPLPEYRAALAGQADRIAAADSGLMAAEASGIRPHWIIGDMDSLDDPRRLERYPPECILRYPADKDYTDTELALTLLWDQGCDETWLIGGGGGRTDHLLALRALFERERTPDRWFTASEDMRRLRPGERFTAELSLGSLVSVFPLGTGPWKAQSHALKWPLDGVAWNRGYAGISNVTAGNPVLIEAAGGSFLAVLPLAAL